MDFFDEHERAVIRHACAGTWCEFPETDDAAAKPAVPARLVRDLLLGRPHPFDGGHTPCAAAGVRIRRARITGALDLSDCSLDGGPLPSLQLYDCEIEQPMHLAGARIGFVSIERSAFVHLNLCGANLGSALDFRHARRHAPDREAWIDARAARIHGQVLGSFATLATPPPRTGEALRGVQFGQRRAALLFRDADIHGTVVLQGVRASGGVSFDTAHVRGDIWAHDATFGGGEIDAFRAQNATIDGSLMLYHNERPAARADVARPRISGMVWLYGTRLRGTVSFAGARIHGTSNDGARAPGPDRTCIEMSHASVGADLDLSQMSAIGCVRLVNTTIGGSLMCEGMRLANRAARESCAALDAYNARVGRDVTFGPSGDDPADLPTVIAGQMRLANADIGGRLLLSQLRIRDLRRVRPAAAGRPPGLPDLAETPPGDSCAIDAAAIRVGKGLECRTPLHVFGSLDLAGATIAGNVAFAGGLLENRTADGGATAIDLQRASIGGSLRLEDDLRINGELNLLGCQVGRDLTFKFCTVDNPGRSAVFAKDISVGGDLRLLHLTARGLLRFVRAQVTGVLLWEALHIGRTLAPAATGREHTRAPLDLNHARIATAIRAKWLTFAPPSRIDLSGARTSTLEWSRTGWGDLDQAGGCPIDLDGFAYDRLVLLAPDLTGQRGALARGLRFVFGARDSDRPPGDTERLDLLCWWLRRQYAPEGSVSEFFPQPYRQLVRVLRAQGDDTLARLVSHEEQRRAPAGGWLDRAWRWVFGRFGYGLRPSYAMAAVLAYLLLGTFGVWLARDQDRLVETVQLSAGYTAPMPTADTPPAHRIYAMLRAGPAGGTDQGEIACFDAAGSLPEDFFYALDMVMPFISLHQETRCDIGAGGGWANAAFRFARALYTLGGWIVASLALVTFSGLLRRFERDPD